MDANQRRFPRFDVRLAVRYSSASEFVNDYVENLSQGGLFIAGAKLEMFSITPERSMSFVSFADSVRVTEAIDASAGKKMK